MTIVNRKLGFYSIRLNKPRKKDEFVDPKKLCEFFDYIDTLDRNNRIFDKKAQNKFHFLTSHKQEGDIQKVLFVSAKYHYRPPLVDKLTATARNNPKTLSEGESEKTHIALKYKKDEIIVIMEERPAGISINGIAQYIGHHETLRCKKLEKKREWIVEFNIIPKDDFLGEMRQLSRLSLGQIYIDKKILGSEFLDFSNKVKQVKKELVLSVKAEKNESILPSLEDIYSKFSSDNNQTISKIRVQGSSDQGHKILLDTDIIKKISYLEADIGQNDGVVVSDSFFQDMATILKEY